MSKTTLIHKVEYDEKNEGFFVYVDNPDFEEGDFVKKANYKYKFISTNDRKDYMFEEEYYLMVCTNAIQEEDSYKYLIMSLVMQTNRIIKLFNLLKSGDTLTKIGRTTSIKYILKN